MLILDTFIPPLLWLFFSFFALGVYVPLSPSFTWLQFCTVHID